MSCLCAPQGSLATGLFSRTNQICHSRDVCSVASEGEATELPPILDCGQHAVVIVGNVRGTGRMIGVGDREHHDASATRDGIAATTLIELTVSRTNASPVAMRVCTCEKSQGSAGVAARPCMS
jgi:hypothetical protein